MDNDAYQLPKIWEFSEENGGQFAGINRPSAGPTHEAALPKGTNPFQLYSLATPNGAKVTILFEELVELGIDDAEYNAWPINIMEGDQFGTEFCQINPNSKVPALLDCSGSEPIRVFESGAILLHLAEKFERFLPVSGGDRTQVLNWLMWQMGTAPLLGGGFGHFFAYAPTKMKYPIDRYTMEVKRQFDVLDRRLEESQFLAGDFYSIADIAAWPWYGEIMRGDLYQATEFLQTGQYSNVLRWTNEIADRPAVKRGRIVNRAWGKPEEFMLERHTAADFV